MVALASRVMLGEPLASLGYGTGLYKAPPYYAVKVPVFSFEKLNDVNSIPVSYTHLDVYKRQTSCCYP